MERAAQLLVLAVCVVAGCNSAAPFAFDSSSPWPKFRGNAQQDGRATFSPRAGGALWSYPTQKGVFSSPVVGGDGTIYVGSADRTFYALDRSGHLAWQLLTGEIIDSAALLDDRGHVYFGSGDGNLRALEAATGAPLWMTAADAPSVNHAFINWFEGNVALSPSGQLYVPNDNWFVYTVERQSGQIEQRITMPDQTWSLPAVDGATGDFFLGNNNVVSFLGNNLFAFNAKQTSLWQSFSPGTVAASPMIAGGTLFVGGFDGYVRAFDPLTGTQKWSFAARDHLYASPAQLADGTVLQASADGSLYALDPSSGALKWTFDGRDPIRSSPAVDGEGRIYFGAGDGRLYVLNADGTLRWSMLLIDADRSDINASPALGRDAVYIAGESGEVFSIPYDYCLSASGQADARCAPPTPLALPAEGAALLFTSAFGHAQPSPPASINANEPIVLSLIARQGAHNRLALLDDSSVAVTVQPAAAVSTTVSANGSFLVVTPSAQFAAAADGTMAITVTANYLINPTRAGLALSGGTPGGTVTFAATIPLVSPAAAPFAPQIPGTTWEVSRLALPLPTLLPSYNQIGFDSLLYLVGLVEGSGDHAVAWMVGATLAAASNTTIFDPTTQSLLPLQVSYDGGFMTLQNQGGLSVEVMNAVIPFSDFRLSAALDATGNAVGPLRVNGSTVCSGIPLYGLFLQTLGLCNAVTDLLVASGAAIFTVYEGRAPPTAAQAGTVTFAATTTAVTATITGTTLLLMDHIFAILLVDAGSGIPVSLNYGIVTTRTADANGLVTGVNLPIANKTVPKSVRAYLMVDVTPVASTTLTLPSGT